MSRDNTPEGLANAWDHLCVTSRILPPLPKRFKRVKSATQTPAKLEKKKTQNTHYLPINTELSGFQMTSARQVQLQIPST